MISYFESRHYIPLPRKCVIYACANIIWPLRSIQPQPVSVVNIDWPITGKSRRYVNQIRLVKSCLKTSIVRDFAGVLAGLSWKDLSEIEIKKLLNTLTWSLPAGRLGVFLDTQTLKKHTSGHPKYFVKNFLKCQSQAYNLIFSSLYDSHDTV